MPRSPKWTPEELATLADLYPAAPKKAVLAAIPGRTWNAIGLKAVDADPPIQRICDGRGSASDPPLDPTDESSQHIIGLRDALSHEKETSRGLARQLGMLRESSVAVAEAVTALKPPPLRRAPVSKGKRAVMAVADLGDWQIGEVVSAEETAGFGVFDYEIAQARVAHLVDSFLKYLRTQRTGYKIEELYIRELGDMISGDIHEELRRYNEWPAPVQTAKAASLFADGVRRLAGDFSVVHLDMLTTDNHGRLTVKPQAKKRGENNFMFLFAVIVEEMLARCSNVHITTHSDIRPLVRVGKTRWLIEHGNDVRAWMGIPYYGMNRARGREAIRRVGESADRGFDYRAMGHWHVPAIVEGRDFITGSLTGTTEYDHAAGRHALPSQVTYFVGDHGPFNWTAWNLFLGPGCAK